MKDIKAGISKEVRPPSPSGRLKRKWPPVPGADDDDDTAAQLDVYQRDSKRELEQHKEERKRVLEDKQKELSQKRSELALEQAKLRAILQKHVRSPKPSNYLSRNLV
jgi:hypothetical protein